MTDYAELHCLSNFSFQRGASSAAELFERAARHGYQALAVTDECTMAGIVRAWQAAQENQLRLIVGSEMQIQGGPKVVLLAENLTGYQVLCDLITRSRRRAEKGDYCLLAEDFDQPLQGLLALWIPESGIDDGQGRWLKQRFNECLWIAVELHCGPDDAARLQELLACAERLQIRPVAAGDVHMPAAAGPCRIR